MEDVLTRIERGAAYLDAAYPGWDRELDIESINVGSSCACPLGLASGDFGKASFRMGLSGLSLFEYGFLWRGDIYLLDEINAEAMRLTFHWRAYLHTRRASQKIVTAEVIHA